MGKKKEEVEEPVVVDKKALKVCALARLTQLAAARLGVPCAAAPGRGTSPRVRWELGARF